MGKDQGLRWDNPCPSLSWPPLQWSESCGELITRFHWPPGPEQAEMAPLWDIPRDFGGATGRWELPPDGCEGHNPAT